jgi:hypothetical protein
MRDLPLRYTWVMRFRLRRETHPTAEFTLISGPIIGIFALGNESVNA